MKKFQKLLAAAVAGALLSTSALGVAAVGRKDVFNAKYYADTYADLKAAFGYNEEALYKHYLTYGTKEGRKMTPVLDIVKYRETYKDLDKAFGDNWDAYVQHYFTFGMKEKRVSGGTFDPVAYAEAYSDIKKAFGNNYKAIINHYLTYGIREGRTAGVTIVTAPASGGSSSDDGEAPAAKPAPPAPKNPTFDEKVTAAKDTMDSASKSNVLTVVAELKEQDKDALSVSLLNDQTQAKSIANWYVDKVNAGITDASKKIKDVTSDTDGIKITSAILPTNFTNASNIKVVGAAMNLEEGKTAPTLELKASEEAAKTAAKAAIKVDDTNQIQVVDLKLNNVKTDASGLLEYPVMITAPVPNDMGTEAFQVLHEEGGKYKVLPSKVEGTAGSETVTFVTKSFSTFVFANGVVTDEAELVKAVAADSKLTKIHLYNDIQLADTITINPATVAEGSSAARTIDFGGYTVTVPAGKDGFHIANTAQVTMKDGYINVTPNADVDQCDAIAFKSTSTTTSLTLGEAEGGKPFGVTADEYGVSFYGGGSVTIEKTALVYAEKGTGVAITKSRKNDSNKLTVTIKGTVKGYYAGLSLNGENVAESMNDIIVEGGTLITDGKYHVTEPADKHDGSSGMYLAGVADTTIKSGSTISGSTGIEIRAGKLTIEGGTITGKAGHLNERPNGDGSTVCGAALSVSQHTTTKKIDVSISGGTFQAEGSGIGLCISDIQGKVSGQPVLVKITGATAAFRGGEAAIAAKITNGTGVALDVGDSVTTGIGFKDERTTKSDTGNNEVAAKEATTSDA